MASQKPVHTIVLDTGAIIRNHPTVSTLLAQSEQIVTVPAIITEIRDAATRSRVETTLKPFLTLRSPTPASIKFVTDFARKTGDLAVLSKPDIQIVALAYELECERNGGDWRLRRNPGQKGTNGSPPAKTEEPKAEESKTEEPKVEESKTEEPKVEESKTEEPKVEESKTEGPNVEEGKTEEPKVEEGKTEEAATGETQPSAKTSAVEAESEAKVEPTQEGATQDEKPVDVSQESSATEETTIPEQTPDASVEQISEDLSKTDLNTQLEASSIEAAAEEEDASDSDSDSDGWITPSNLKKHQIKDASATTSTTESQTTLQVATLTTDFAMQNVLLQINLNLLSENMQRVKHLKTYILRCHACFCTTKEMSKQFCPRCGNPTLTRVACTTASNGEFKLHLKKNMQWNTRGDRYSIPKAVHGSSNGRVVGGGKGHWGNELILTEDQKEFEKIKVLESRRKERDLMDEEYLPSILTGDRNRAVGGRIRVGAGRNVNSKKR